MDFEFIKELIVRDYDLLVVFFTVAFPVALLVMIIEKITKFFLQFVTGEGVARFR